MQTLEQKTRRNQKISATKNTPEGKRRHKDALEKCRHKISAKLKGRKPWNKLEEHQKIKIKCHNCSKEKLLIPSKVRERNYCDKKCLATSIKNRAHINWNPNSNHGQGGFGVAGTYKNIKFRSLLELSFVYHMLHKKHILIFEPYYIPMSEYLSAQEMEIYDIKQKQRYYPDYLVDLHLLVEVKPESVLYNWDPDKIVLAKTLVLERFCKKKKLEYDFISEPDISLLGGHLTTKQIKLISDLDISFYKTRHDVKYRI